MQHTAVHLLKTSWAPSNSSNFYTKHMVALYLFCCHSKRCSYLRGIGLLQLCWVIQRSINKAERFRCLMKWLGKNQTQGWSHEWNSDCWHQTRNKKNVFRLESRNNKQWQAKSSTQLHCHLCSSRTHGKGTTYKCARWDVGLCAVPCIEEYHPKVNLYITPIVNTVCCDKTVIHSATDLM